MNRPRFGLWHAFFVVCIPVGIAFMLWADDFAEFIYSEFDFRIEQGHVVIAYLVIALTACKIGLVLERRSKRPQCEGPQ